MMKNTRRTAIPLTITFLMATMVIMVTPAIAVTTADWPRFHNDLQSTGYSPENVSPPLFEVWKYNTGYPIGGSSPVVKDGTLYIGSDNGYLYALDATTGNLKWSKFLCQQVWNARVHQTPTVHNGIVYVGSFDHWFYALRASDGYELWKRDLGHRLMWGSTVANGLVYVGTGNWDDQSGNAVYALDAATGTTVWSYPTTMAASSAPAIWDNIIYFTVDYDGIIALDALHGTLKWSMNIGASAGNYPVIMDGVVYVRGGGWLYALRATDGFQIWMRSLGADVTTPAVHDGVVYATTYGGNLYALDASSGSEKWHYPAPISGWWSCPIISDDYVYATLDGPYVLRAGDGALLQSIPGFGIHPGSSPAIANGMVYAGGTDGYVRAFMHGNLKFDPSSTSIVAEGASATLKVRLTDDYGNPIPGIPITFSSIPTLTFLPSNLQTTDSNGYATVTTSSTENVYSVKAMVNDYLCDTWTLTIDKTPPEVTLTADRSPDHNGWYNHDVTFTVSATDVNGVVEVDSPITYSSPDSDTASVTGHAKDAAGNTGTATATFMFDKTPPIISGAATSQPNDNGWYKTSVTIHFEASDAMSGLDTKTADTTLSGEGGGQSVTGSATDKAGNSASTTVSGINIDKTAPTVSLTPDRLPDCDGWYNHPVTYTVTATDSLSDSVMVDGPFTYSGPTSASATLTGHATDAAGNTAEGVAVFKYVNTPSTLPATVLLISSSGDPIQGATVQYYSGGWQQMGVTDSQGIVYKPITPGSYTFRVSYGGASLDKTQNVGANPLVVFQTRLANFKILDSKGDPLQGGAQYYANGWKTFGSGQTPASMELLPVSYTFRASYAGASLDKTQNIASNTEVTFQTNLVSFKLLDSGNNEMQGDAQYYANGWKTFGNGKTGSTKEMLPVGYTFRVSYGGASQDKTQNIGGDQLVVFQTKLVILQVLDSSGSSELAAGAQYYANGWKVFGGGTTTATMEMLPVSYTFRVSYGGASLDKTQNIASSGNVVFRTVSVSFKLLDSGGSDLTGEAQYYANGWKAFGSTKTGSTMEMLPVSYTFRVCYGGANLDRTQNVAGNPNVVFMTKQVSFKLLDSKNNEIIGGAQYYSSGWKTFGSGLTTTTMELLPVSYTFRVSYGGASLDKTQNVDADADVEFWTVPVSFKLLGSDGSELAAGAQYYANGWKVFGGGTTTATMEMLPVSYTFRVSYGGASLDKTQNVATNIEVVFETVKVHSDSGSCTMFYANGWKAFQNDMEMLPVNYTFRFSDGFPDKSYSITLGSTNHIH